MLVVNGQLPSLRPLAPLGLVVAILAGLAASPISVWPLVAVMSPALRKQISVKCAC